MNLSQTLTKQQAREMLMASLPVRDDVLMPLMEALVQIGAAAKQRRQAVSGPEGGGGLGRGWGLPVFVFAAYRACVQSVAGVDRPKVCGPAAACVAAHVVPLAVWRAQQVVRPALAVLHAWTSAGVQ